VCLDKLHQWIGWTAAGPRWPLGPPCASAPSASSTPGRWSLLLGVFARPPRPNVLTGATRREAFVRGFLDETIIDVLGPSPTQERLGSLPTTSSTSPSRQAEPSHLLGGSSWSRTPWCTPVDSPASRTTRWRPTSTTCARPAPPPDLRRLGGHEPCGSATPHGSAMSAWPRRQGAPNQS
jgi:hypothetical protein